MASSTAMNRTERRLLIAATAFELCLGFCGLYLLVSERALTS